MFAIVFVLASTGGLIPRSCDRRGRGDGRAQGRGRWTPVCTERSGGRPEAPPTPPRVRGRLGPGRTRTRFASRSRPARAVCKGRGGGSALSIPAGFPSRLLQDQQKRE